MHKNGASVPLVKDMLKPSVYPKKYYICITIESNPNNDKRWQK